MPKIKKKSIVYRPKYGNFIHEVINTIASLRKKARPYKLKVRTIPVDSHRVTLGFWGRKDRYGRHAHTQVQKILHPIKLFYKKVGYRLRKGETVKAKMTPMGRRVSLTALRKAVQRKIKRKGAWKTKKNLPSSSKKPVKIYDKVIAIIAVKDKNSNFPRQRFIHKFNKKAGVYGLPDGSLLIKGAVK